MPLIRHWARWVATVVGGALGFWIAAHAVSAAEEFLSLTVSKPVDGAALALGVIVFAAVGFFVGPAVARWVSAITHWLENRLVRLPGADIIIGSAGAILGLIVALLLGPALSHIPTAGDWLPAVASVFLAYLGWRVFVTKRNDLLHLIRPARRSGGGRSPVVRTSSRLRGAARAKRAGAPAAGPAEASGSTKVLDTSSIIDGRIADLYKTGFLEGPLCVPAFVLDELRHIADSNDPLKRSKGRRGLDILTAMQRDPRAKVQIIHGAATGAAEEVDSALLRVARELGAKVLTTDYNLNKVAGLQGVEVLNVNELANALKPSLLPGEDIHVRVVREGKEAGQGVGYLDDGTMIVIDGGRRFVGEEIAVEVTSAIQTAAGRLIFARPRAAAPLQRVAERG